MPDLTPDDDRKYRAPALEKGLDVLELLSAQGQAMTPSQMSVTLGRSVSELFRMIQVLEFRGYIEQSSDGYSLTNRLFTLGMTQAPIKSLADVALPAMRDLAADTLQSCHLVVPSGDQIVVIARIESAAPASRLARASSQRPSSRNVVMTAAVSKYRLWWAISAMVPPTWAVMPGSRASSIAEYPQETSTPTDTSVSMVEDPCRAVRAAAEWNGQAE